MSILSESVIMRKGKIEKYAEVSRFPNVIEYELDFTEPVTIKNTWKNSFARKDGPITLELGCGRGEYTLHLARLYPERNFIGIDIKGTRIWHGAQCAIEEQLGNVFFVRMPVEFISSFFPRESIAEIWVTFPDPIHKRARKNSRKRLTSPFFLDIYKKILVKSGTVHLKTDDDILFQFSRESALGTDARIEYETDDLYSSAIKNDAVRVQTKFEKQFLSQNKSIKYLSFSYC